MIKTSTPVLDFTEKLTKQTTENQLPSSEVPSEKTIENILNYSRNLVIQKSRFVNEVEFIKS